MPAICVAATDSPPARPTVTGIAIPTEATGVTMLNGPIAAAA